MLKRFDFAEMLGDPSVEATRLPQMHVAVKELTDKLKLKGNKVWYAIAGHVVFTRFVKLPPFEDAKADQIVEFEARQNVPFPINEVTWDYEFINGGESGEREVALVAIRSDGLNDINDQLETAGVEVVGVDLAPLAVFNAFRYCYPDVDEPALIIDLGARSTNLVFVEGSKLFTRNILVGGSTVTGAISKDFGVAFGEAEEQKRQKGYIAPGGAYEPNEDETVEAISKIMRHTMTRLHGEVVRTINYFRTQQGGSPPRRIFLCGGGCQTPLVVDFFQEKFNLPVEILNSLRGIQLDRKLDAGRAQANAGALAEIVGLALRHVGSVPVEVELVPEAVAGRRDAAKRAPFLILSTLCLFAVLLVGIFYFKQAQAAVQGEVTKLTNNREELRKYDNSLKDVDKKLQALRGTSMQYEGVVNDRAFWVRVLDAMNNKFENDYLWLTQVEVLKNGQTISPSPAGTGGPGAPPSLVVPQHPQTTAAKPGAVPPPVEYQLRVHGLYRKDAPGGPEVVYKYFNNLKSLSDLFLPTDKKPNARVVLEEDRYAYNFDFELPLTPGMKFDK